jgi:hypothetical protein
VEKVNSGGTLVVSKTLENHSLIKKLNALADIEFEKVVVGSGFEPEKA